MNTVTKKTELVTSESKVRLIAFFVFLLTAIYAYTFPLKTSLLFIPLFLIIDFSARSSNLMKFSPLATAAGWLVAVFKLPAKPVFLPPKRFAARVGLAFSVAIFIIHLTGHNPLILTGILCCFAALEAFAGFCAGCYVFDFIQEFKRVKA